MEASSPAKGKTKTTSNAPRKQKKDYERSLDKISNCFLQKVDNYFDNTINRDIPSSKI